MASLGDLMVRVGADVSNFKSTMGDVLDTLATSEKRFDSSAEAADRWVEKLNAGIDEKFGSSVAAATDKVSEFSTQSQAMADQVANVSGAASEFASQSQAMAEQITQFSGAASNAVPTLEQLGTGAKSADDAWQGLGDSVSDTGDRFRTAEEMTESERDALERLKQQYSQIPAASAPASAAIQDFVGKQERTNITLKTAEEVLAAVTKSYQEGTQLIPGYVATVSDVAKAQDDVNRAAAAAHPELKHVHDALQSSGQASTEAAAGMKDFADKLVAIGEALVIVETLKEFAKEALGAYDNVQKTSNALTALTGSSAAAEEVLSGIEAIAKRQPFAFPELADGARRMALAHVEAGKIPSVLDTIANVARGTGNSFDMVAGSIERVALMGQVNARQLVQFGLSWGDLAKAAGMSVDQVQARLKKGGQDAMADLDLILKAAQEKFGGFAKIPLTIGESWQVLQNQIHAVMVEIGQALAPVAASILGIVQSNILPVLDSVVKAFAALPLPVKDGIIALAGLTAGLAVAALGLGGFGLAMAGVQTAITEVGVLLGMLGTSWAAVGAAAVAAAPVIAAVGVVIAGLHFTEADTAALHFASTLKDNFGGILELFSGIKDAWMAVANAIMSASDTVGKGIADSLGLIFPWVMAVQERFAQLRESLSTPIKFNWADAIFPQFALLRDGLNVLSLAAQWLGGNYKAMAGDVSAETGKLVTAAHQASVSGEEFKAAWNMSEWGLNVTKVAAAIEDFVNKQQKTNATLKDAQEVLTAVTKSYQQGTELVPGYVASMSDVAKAQDNVKRAAEAVNPELKKMHDALQTFVKAEEKTTKTLTDAQNVLDAVTKSYQQGTQLVPGYVATQQDVAKAQDAVNKAMKAAYPEITNVFGAIGEFAKQQQTANVKLQDAQAVLAAVTASYKNGTELIPGYVATQQDVTKAQDAVNKALVATHPELKKLVEETDKLRESIKHSNEIEHEMSLIQAGVTAGISLEAQAFDALSQKVLSGNVSLKTAKEITSELKDGSSALTLVLHSQGTALDELTKKTDAETAANQQLDDAMKALGIRHRQTSDQMLENLKIVLNSTQATSYQKLQAEHAYLQQVAREYEQTYGYVPLTMQKALRKMEDELSLHRQRVTAALDEIRKLWTQMSDDIAKGFADVLVEGKDFGDTMVNIFKSIAKTIIEDLIKGALLDLGKALLGIETQGKSLIDIFKSVAGSVSNVGTSVTGAIPGGAATTNKTLSDVVNQAQGVGPGPTPGVTAKGEEAATSAVSDMSSQLLAVGVAGLGVSIASGIVSGIQQAHANTLLGRIEESTRWTKGLTIQFIDLAMRYWPGMDQLNVITQDVVEKLLNVKDVVQLGLSPVVPLLDAIHARLTEIIQIQQAMFGKIGTVSLAAAPQTSQLETVDFQGEIAKATADLAEQKSKLRLLDLLPQLNTLLGQVATSGPDETTFDTVTKLVEDLKATGLMPDEVIQSLAEAFGGAVSGGVDPLVEGLAHASEVLNNMTADWKSEDVKQSIASLTSQIQNLTDQQQASAQQQQSAEEAAAEEATRKDPITWLTKIADNTAGILDQLRSGMIGSPAVATTMEAALPAGPSPEAQAAQAKIDEADKKIRDLETWLANSSHTPVGNAAITEFTQRVTAQIADLRKQQDAAAKDLQAALKAETAGTTTTAGSAVLQFGLPDSVTAVFTAIRDSVGKLSDLVAQGFSSLLDQLKTATSAIRDGFKAQATPAVAAKIEVPGEITLSEATLAKLGQMLAAGYDAQKSALDSILTALATIKDFTAESYDAIEKGFQDLLSALQSTSADEVRAIEAAAPAAAAIILPREVELADSALAMLTSIRDAAVRGFDLMQDGFTSVVEVLRQVGSGLVQAIQDVGTAAPAGLPGAPERALLPITPSTAAPTEAAGSTLIERLSSAVSSAVSSSLAEISTTIRETSSTVSAAVSSSLAEITTAIRETSATLVERTSAEGASVTELATAVREFASSSVERLSSTVSTAAAAAPVANLVPAIEPVVAAAPLMGQVTLPDSLATLLGAIRDATSEGAAVIMQAISQAATSFTDFSARGYDAIERGLMSVVSAVQDVASAVREGTQVQMQMVAAPHGPVTINITVPTPDARTIANKIVRELELQGIKV